MAFDWLTTVTLLSRSDARGKKRGEKKAQRNCNRHVVTVKDSTDSEEVVVVRDNRLTLEDILLCA